MSELIKSVTNNYDGVSIRDFLKEELGLSSRLIRRASIEKNIFVNDEAVRMRKTVHTGDVIKVNLNRQESQDIVPENMDLDIVYEDTEILVVNKPPFIVVHPTKSYQSGTLSNGIIYYFQSTNQNCIVRLVSRLDMNTSGLIIIAKNQFAHMALSKEMQNNNVEKRYLAVVHGHLENEEGTIDAPIYREEEGERPSLKRVVDERGQRSITHYKLVQRLKDADLVECKLETGRTHQIRVHLSYIGNPIFGDTLYGECDDTDFISRQALHAYSLKLKSPRTMEELSLISDLPQDIKDLIKKLS